MKNLENTNKKVILYAEDIVATVRVPMLLLDDNLKVVLANRSFTRHSMYHQKKQ